MILLLLSGIFYLDDEPPPEKEIHGGGIRLKLKVSGEVYSPLHDTASTSGEKKHKHKKKKKKKKAEKEKRRLAEASIQVMFDYIKLDVKLSVGIVF